MCATINREKKTKTCVLLQIVSPENSRICLIGLLPVVWSSMLLTVTEVQLMWESPLLFAPKLHVSQKQNLLLKIALVIPSKDIGLFCLITCKLLQCFLNPSYTKCLRETDVCLPYKRIHCGAIVGANPVICCLLKSFHITEQFTELGLIKIVPQVDAHSQSHVERNSLAFKDEDERWIVFTVSVSKVPWYYTSSLYGLAPKERDISFMVGSIPVARLLISSHYIYMFWYNTSHRNPFWSGEGRWRLFFFCRRFGAASKHVTIIIWALHWFTLLSSLAVTSSKASRCSRESTSNVCHRSTAKAEENGRLHVRNNRHCVFRALM